MRQEDYRATLILMLGLAAATLTGFGREAALAQQLGVGRSTDVYLIAFAIPEFLFVALPIVLSPAFIPLFADLRLRLGEERAWRFGRRVALALLVLLLGVVVLAAVAAPVYLPWLAPGFDPVERAQAQQAQLLMLPAILLMGGATLAGAVLQVYRRFARPALATAVYNIVFVAALLSLPLAWPAGRAAWGVTLGAAAALLLQATLLWRYRPSRTRPANLEPAPRPAETGSTPAAPPPGIRDLFWLAGPLAAAYAVHHLILFIDRAMATTVGTGSAATLNYAYRLALVVGQLSGLAVSTALFPHMAERAAGRDLAGLRRSLAAALRFVWLVGLPASLGLIVLRKPLVQVLFQRGAFDASATAAVSGALVWYAVAVLADAFCQPLWRVLYARRSNWAVLAINGLQTGVRLLANFALIHSLGYNGLALSAALGLSVQAIVLGLLVRRQIGNWLPRRWWQNATGIGLAAIAAAVVAAMAKEQVPGLSPVWNLVLGGVPAGLVYLAIVGLGKKWLL